MIPPLSIGRYNDTLPCLGKPTEGAVVDACIRWLFTHGCFVWRNNTGAYKPVNSNRFIRYGKKGSPDIVGVTPNGAFIGVECKTGKNKQSDDQIHFQREIEAKNGLYIVAYSVDDLEFRKAEIA